MVRASAVAAGGRRPAAGGTVRRRSLLAGAFGGAATAIVSACGASGGAASGGGGFSVTDQRGKRLHFDRPVRRLVTIPMPAASIAIAVDESADHLVGMHSSSWTAIHDGIMGKMFPKALRVAHGIATEEFAPNVESIVALTPDAVIQWSDQGAGLVAPLENAGLTVVGLSYGTQRDLAVWITVFGLLFGKQTRAARINTMLRDRLGDFRSHQAPSHPSILYFNRFVGGYKVAAGGTYNDFCFRLVGATNAAGGMTGTGMLGVDVEQVLAWDPDVLLLGNFDAAQPADVYRSPVLRDMSAVRHRRVYKVPLGGYRWDPPSHESPLMWRWLSMIADPDEHDSDLRAEIVRDYQFLYGYTPSGAQLDQILWIDENGDSAGYQRFHAA